MLLVLWIVQKRSLNGIMLCVIKRKQCAVVAVKIVNKFFWEITRLGDEMTRRIGNGKKMVSRPISEGDAGLKRLKTDEKHIGNLIISNVKDKLMTVFTTLMSYSWPMAN